MLVGDVMTPAPLCVRRLLPLRDALEQMRDHAVRHLLVVDDDGALVGLLTERDLKRYMSRAFETKLEKPIDRMSMLAPVEQVMTAAPFTVRTHAPLRDVVLAMHDKKFGAVPVLDEEGKPAGILSSIDLLRVLAARL